MLITDKGIRTYKKKKPINNFLLRKKIALMIKDVKHVIPVNSPLKYSNLAKKYKFEFLVHGDDWKTGVQSKSRKKLIQTMKEWKGKVIDIPYTKGISSTRIKDRIKDGRSNKKNFWT